MAGKPAPGGQINCHTGIGGANLQGLVWGQATHAISDGIQRATGAPLVARVIEGISLHRGGGAVIHGLALSFLDGHPLLSIMAKCSEFFSTPFVFLSIKSGRMKVSIQKKGNKEWKSHARYSRMGSLMVRGGDASAALV